MRKSGKIKEKSFSQRSLYAQETREVSEKTGKNPFVEYNKIRNRYCTDLFRDFADTKDPRKQSYTEYSNDELIGTMFYKGIAGIKSMQSMTYELNRERSEEKRKQDCETKAFQRLAGRIKKVYPRLPILLLADSLYASKPVMDICHDNGWQFIIRYKTGSIPSITEKYENISKKEMSRHAEYVNDIDYNGKPVNMLWFWEKKIVDGETVRTEFQWLTGIRILQKNAEKIAGAGRKR